MARSARCCAGQDCRAVDLRAAAGADERRSRKAGRDQRRVDPAAHRHPRAPHRRSGRGDVGSREGGGDRRDAAGRASRPTSIGFIVVGTTTPDTIFPSTACMLQDKIGAHHAWGFDLGAACSGFTYALTTGMQMVATGAHDHALVRRRRRDVEHHRLHRSHDLRAVRRRRRRGRARRRRTRASRTSSTSRTRSTAAADRRCACRPAAAGCPRRTRPSTSGCTT